MRISDWSSDVCSSDLARTRHAAVGEQGDAKALVLEHPQSGRQFVQFGHAVGARALKAHDDDDVALELARLECGKHLILVVEDPARRLGDRKSTRLNSSH